MKNRTSLLTRTGWLFALAVAALLGAAHGCNQAAEGDRCNPDLATGENDCGSGLSCQQPVDCPENYCCPTEGPVTSPFCQKGCNGGQASICDAGGDADCAEL